jgi:hypothetical protein
MTYHTIQLSDPIYRLLLKQAERLQISPIQVLEALVSDNSATLDLEADSAEGVSTSFTDRTQALAAVHHLSTLFADLIMPDLDQVLHDPFLSLTNADLLEPVG